MDKNRKILLGALAAVALVCVIVLVVLVRGGDKSDGLQQDSSSQAVSVITVEDSVPAPEDSSESEVSTAATTTTTTATTTSTTAPATTTKRGKTTPKKTTTAAEVKTYKFRSQKLLDQHFEKHGSEFGDITKEDYLRMANELINSKAETVLSKTEKEDGDYVFFDKATGYFAVLSKDGYIRTFFIPDRGIDYYNKQ